MKKIASTVFFLVGFVLLAVGGYLLTPVAFGQKMSGHGTENTPESRAHRGNGHGKGMPMMHRGMSQDEMKNFCDRMQQHHAAMKKRRRQNAEKLNGLVQSMKNASGEAKIEAMQETLVELVNQHQKRGKTMMRSMHAMMGSMMGMHRMSDRKRQRMMREMKQCPMMRGTADSDGGTGTSMMHHSAE